MKKVIIAIAALVFTTGAFAQEVPPPTKDTVPTTQVPATQKKSGYLMQEGKMYVVKQDEKTEQTEDITLTNGTIVMKNGTVKTTDGQTVTLKDGQYIDLEGNIKVWEEVQ